MKFRRSQAGFTLVELLISFVLTTLISGGLVLFLAGVYREASDNRQIVTMQRELVPVLDYIADEVQPAARLYGSTGITIASGSINVTDSNAQPLVGFFVQCRQVTGVSTCSASTNPDQYLFRLFYLASPPTGASLYNGPRLLYYADCTTRVTASDAASLPATPTCATMNAGLVVDDGLPAQTTGATPPINTFVIDAVATNQKYAGTLYLNGTSAAMSASNLQPIVAADRSLNLTTRIATRN